jgi:hypothetical protein
VTERPSIRIFHTCIDPFGEGMGESMGETTGENTKTASGPGSKDLSAMREHLPKMKVTFLF